MACKEAFTPEQRKCVELCDGPLVISAGAGSGKTSVLTQKIVHALAREAACSEARFGIDEILAITFTEKAAEELRFRLKEALRAEGMHDQALLVDEAWVSTIHGMCLRMLKEHAIELGLAPDFKVVEDASARRLIGESIEEALQCHEKRGLSAELDKLFLEYPSRSTARNARGSVRGMVRSLVEKAVASPEGAEVFKMAARPRQPRRLVEAFLEMARAANELVLSQRESGRRSRWLELFEAFVGQEASLRFGSDLSSVLKCIELCPRPSADFGSRSYKDEAKRLQRLHADLLAEAEALFTAPFAELLLSLARFAYGSYVRKKQEQGLLDNDDLLIRTAAAFREAPGMMAAYGDKFRLVMVDEFQDTDRLQLQIISHLSGDSGERLCVVGDIQQSIYRFRGADATLFERHIRKVQEAHSDRVVELRDNFRSHEAVLGFVDAVFGREGEGAAQGYMPLRASRPAGEFPAFGGQRVKVLRTTYEKSPAAARRCEARRIAREFRRLKDAGCNLTDMALLLGRMTNADAYAQAMRREGLPCAISGGSTFSRAVEVRIVQRLVEVIANPRATAALYDLLSSDMFGLDASDFLALSAKAKAHGGASGKRPINEGLREAAAGSCCGRFSQRLRHAASVLERACFESRGENVADIAMRCIIDSGWMARLEARGIEGLAAAANVLKAVRTIGDLERKDSFGAASTSAAFAAYLDSAKEPPGTLPGRDEECVRIMTVHASKGLEFPVVAVAEMERASPRSGALRCETVEGEVFCSLRSKASASIFKHAARFSEADALDAASDAEGRSFGTDLGALSYAEASRALGAHVLLQELMERRRLLYVALTRAKEAVVVSLLENASARRKKTGLSEDIRQALFGEEHFPKGDAVVSLGRGTIVCFEGVDAEDETLRISEGESLEPSTNAAWLCPPTDRGRWTLPKRFVPAVREASGAASADGRGFEGEGSDACNHAFWTGLTEELEAEADGCRRLGETLRHAIKRSVEDCRRLRASGSPRACISSLGDEALEAISERQMLAPRLAPRFLLAFEQWVGSPEARELETAQSMGVGASVCVPLSPAESVGFESAYYEGAIDAVGFWPETAEDPSSAFAVCVEAASQKELQQEKNRQVLLLKAVCCALALFSCGYASVVVAMLFPDKEGGSPGCGCVRYAFEEREGEELRALAREIHAKVIG